MEKEQKENIKLLIEAMGNYDVRYWYHICSCESENVFNDIWDYLHEKYANEKQIRILNIFSRTVLKLAEHKLI